MRPALHAVASLCLAALAGACGPDAPPGPRWVPLARGFEPQALEGLAARLETRAQPPRQSRVVRDAASGDVHVEMPLDRAGWSAGRHPGEWRRPLPLGGAMQLAARGSVELVAGETTWKLASGRQPRAGPPRPGLRVDEAELVLGLDEGAEPSEQLVLRARLERAGAAGERWRDSLGEVVTDGFLVFPGEPETIECEVPPASRLCFTAVFPQNREAHASPGVVRVELDGKALLEVERPAAPAPPPAWHEVELGADGKRRITFAVEGSSPVLFAAPALAPLEAGTSGARPWPEQRPDLVLVICDTFRADNLAEWGADPELAPNLNGLVERSLRFLDARAAAAWTLPSIGAMMSGVFPGQHGGTDLDRGVVEEVETVAEVLSAHGYRTAAITDSGLFSRHYGQDQGFEWFEEVPVTQWHMKRTLALARAAMERDDGRPLFLVVHTYRVHGPMRVGPEEDGKPWREVLLKARERRRAAGKDPGSDEDDENDPQVRGVALRFYQDAVNDLDAKLGAWFEELEAEGFFARGVLALTADHGNAYGEHGELGHGGELYDVKLRVPLLFAGRGIEARAVRGVVSLVDLPPTLAELAGAAPAKSWLGRSLLRDGPARPAYAFDLKESFRQVALFAEGKKLMATDVEALEEGKPTHAYDLDADPFEEENLAEEKQWPGELARALSDTVERLLVPAAEARSLELPPEVEQSLKNIGYGR